MSDRDSFVQTGRSVRRLFASFGQEKFVATNVVSLAKAYVDFEHACPGDVEVDDREVVAVPVW